MLSSYGWLILFRKYIRIPLISILIYEWFTDSPMAIVLVQAWKRYKTLPSTNIFIVVQFYFAERFTFNTEVIRSNNVMFNRRNMRQ